MNELIDELFKRSEHYHDYRKRLLEGFRELIYNYPLIAENFDLDEINTINYYEEKKDSVSFQIHLKDHKGTMIVIYKDNKWDRQFYGNPIITESHCLKLAKCLNIIEKKHLEMIKE